MTIQILGLRSFEKDGKKITYDAFHDKGWRAPSIKALMADVNSILSMIPDEEKWNLFYTVAECGEGKREFIRQSVVAFDIDGIDKDRELKEYAKVISDVLHIKVKESVFVNSGNGLHILIHLQKPINTKAEFKQLKPHYKEVCRKIDKALASEGLPGNADPSVFEPRRLLRLPGTVNRKPGKPEKLCQVLQTELKPGSFQLELLSGLPLVKDNDALPTNFFTKFPINDPPAVMEGCEFLNWATHNRDDLSEPQWYAALSITARLNDGQGLEGEHWSKMVQRDSTPDDIAAEKMEQALAASGPRTCENIGSISEQCGKCQFKGKVQSPIMIKGKDTIPTEHSGFHTIPFDGKSKPKPQPRDLKRFLERDTPFVGLDNSRIIMKWNGTHYKEWGTSFINSYAEDHYVPGPTSATVREFVELIHRTNLREMSWFADSTKNLINFKNGVLDIRTLELFPHDPKFGFRYVLPYEYDADAKCPAFEKMMRLVTGDDQVLIDILTEFMGYAISGDEYWCHKALVLEGSGSNGKSTFMNVLKMLVGSDSYSTLSMGDMHHEYKLQMLDGKLFNISEETPTSALMESSNFKTLSAGGELSVRKIYKDPYTIRNRAKLIFACNEMPPTKDISTGLIRRLLIIPFDQVITRYTRPKDFDPYIEEKLSHELSGIFNYAIAGYHRLKKQKSFTHSEKVDLKVTSYYQDQNPVMNWLTENVIIMRDGSWEDKFTSIPDLYFDFKTDCEQSGIKNFPTRVGFGKQLAKLVPMYKERVEIRKIDGKTTRVVKGMVLGEEHNVPDDVADNVISIVGMIH